MTVGDKVRVRDDARDAVGWRGMEGVIIALPNGLVEWYDHYVLFEGLLGVFDRGIGFNEGELELIEEA